MNQTTNKQDNKSAETTTLLTAEHIYITYQQRQLIKDISLDLQPGELLGLIGPNGAGKSTLLKALAQLSSYQGNIFYQGKNLKNFSAEQRAKSIAYLQQASVESWPIRVRDYVALGRIPYRQRWLSSLQKQQEQRIINDVLEQTALTEFANRRMHQLSGGEYARVRLARALVVEAPLLLADEPVAALDPFHQLQVMELLKAHCKAGKSVIVVLHDLTLASRFCHRLALLNNGQLVAAGKPREILTPANLQQVYQVNAMLGEHQQQSYVLPWACLPP